MKSKDERIYFVSQYDNQVHNVNDWQHRKIGEKEAYIGGRYGAYEDEENGFIVNEEVDLWTLEEVAKFYKDK